jgi:hypothetical protein
MDLIKKYWPFVFLILFFGVFRKLIGGVLGVAGINPGGSDPSDKLLDGLEANKKNFTKNPDYYRQVAAQTLDAMQGFGTDEETLFSVVKGLNKDELTQVFIEFGEPFTLGLSGTFYANLARWYKDELSASDYNKMKIIWSKTDLLP